MSENVLQKKSFAFALKVVRTYKEITNSQREYVLSKQLLRSGTSVGAMIRESEFAQSKADFISKLSIGLKEANETEYWLLLLKEANYLQADAADKLIVLNKELISMLVASIKTAKNSLKRNH